MDTLQREGRPGEGEYRAPQQQAVKLWEHLPPNDHVFWKLAGFIWVTGLATVFLTATASHFDAGEITTLVGVASSVAGWQFVQGKAPKADDDE